MFDKNTQFVNMIINQQNLKINYKILHNNIISKNEQSIFLLDNNEISNDAKLKIRTLQNDIPKTYISAICEDENQKIVPFDEAITNEYKLIKFDRKNNIILEKDKLLDCTSYYNNKEIDYLLSPFSILQEALNYNLDKKSFNVFIFNNKTYTIILNEDKKLAYNNIGKITSHNEVIQDESFFKDEISKQKLYEEMYLLELQTYIETNIKKLYEKNSNQYFIEKVNIFYDTKQLNEQQLNSLKTNLMLETTYNSITLDEILYKLIHKQDSSKINFINVRKKKSTNSFTMILIVFTILSMLTAGGVFYYKKFIENDNELKKEIKKEAKKKEAKKKIKKKKIIREIALPKHKELNIQKTNLLVSLFNSIGKYEVLKEIQVQKDESTLICDLKGQDSYEKELKPKLLKIYKKSEIVLSVQNKKTKFYTSIISNTKLLKKNIKKNIKIYKLSKKYKILNSQDSTEYLKKIIKNSLITLKNKEYLKYLKYTYNIESEIQSPGDFFNIFQIINKQYYSITLKYPIEFSKLKNKIVVKYILVFNQIRKEKKNIK
jgi:hypothetical protein